MNITHSNNIEVDLHITSHIDGITNSENEITNSENEITNSENEIKELKKIIYDLEFEIQNILLEIESEKIPKIEPYKYSNLISYYINLDSRIDRKEHMEKNVIPYFKNLFKCKRISAIDGENLSLERYIKLNILSPNLKYDDHYYFQRGQLACMISHLNTWKKFLTTDYKYLLLLEDDILINKSYFNNIFDNLMQNLDEIDFDLLFLGRQCLGYKGFYCGIQIHPLFYIPHYFGTGNHSYILNRTGAQNLITYLEKPKNVLKNTYLYPCWPLDRWDIHSKYYKKSMNKKLKIISIIPTKWEKKKKYSMNTDITSNSQDFLFYTKDWQDSDTTRIR